MRRLVAPALLLGGCAAPPLESPSSAPTDAGRIAGALDDWTPAVPCETLTAMLQRACADVRLAVYPDAHHGFDSTRQGPPIRLPNDNVRRQLEEILGPA